MKELKDCILYLKNSATRDNGFTQKFIDNLMIVINEAENSKQLEEEKLWLYGKLNKISDIIEKGREESKNLIADTCPNCENELDWTYEINDDAKPGEDPRVYGEVCCNCGYESYE